MPATVVILGGSFAGLHVAHALLKKQVKDLKVILVSKVCPKRSCAWATSGPGAHVQIM